MDDIASFRSLNDRSLTAKGDNILDLTSEYIQLCYLGQSIGQKHIHEMIVDHAMPGLLYLLAYGRSDRSKAESVQTIHNSCVCLALLSKNKRLHPKLHIHNIAQLLIGLCSPTEPSSVLEAVLATLACLAETRQFAEIINKNGLRCVMDCLIINSVGILCNTVAVISALASHKSITESIIIRGIIKDLHTLCLKYKSNEDISRNIKNTMTALGFSRLIERKGQNVWNEYEERIENLYQMGFHYGNIDLALYRKGIYNGNNDKNDNVNKEEQQCTDNEIIELLLCLPDIPEDPDVVSISAQEILPTTSTTSISSSSSSTSSYNNNNIDILPEQTPLLMKKPSLNELREINDNEQNNVQLLKDMGFTHKQACSGLFHAPSVSLAIDWIVSHEADDNHQNNNDRDDVEEELFSLKPLSFNAPLITSSQTPKTRHQHSQSVSQSHKYMYNIQNNNQNNQNQKNKNDYKYTNNTSFNLLKEDIKKAPMILWLKNHGFENYIKYFEKEKITLDTLTLLAQEDLEQLGITALGDKKRFLNCVQNDEALHNNMNNHQNTTSPLSKNNNKLDIGFLQATLLSQTSLNGQSQDLDFDEEKQMIRNALTESKRALKVRFSVGTTDNLLLLITRGARLLHISGHGSPQALVMEDSFGGHEALSVEKLKKLLVVGRNELQLVMVSQCHSYRAALAFVAAGVKHVIAVHEKSRVKDENARVFARHVYIALFTGLTVQEAFDKGRAAVVAMNSSSTKCCCCSHLHSENCACCPVCALPVCCIEHGNQKDCHKVTTCCSPNLPHNESMKFILLPGKHDTSLFDDVEHGEWINDCPAPIPHNIPPVPGYYRGRTGACYVSVQSLFRPTICRLLQIVGESGIGKTVLSQNVARFVHERQKYNDGCFFIKLSECKDTELIPLTIMSCMRTLTLPSVLTRRSTHSGLQIEEETTANNNIYKFLLEKRMLLIFDGVDLLVETKEKLEKFQLFIQHFLHYCPHITIIMTLCKRVFGGLDGICCRMVQVHPLHPKEIPMILSCRKPRTLLKKDYPIDNIDDYFHHPIFSILPRIPRIIGKCSDLMNHMYLIDVYNYLKNEDVSGWSDEMPEKARSLLLDIHAYIYKK